MLFLLGIGPTGAYAIADGLRSNTALRHLDLCDNEVSDAGVAAIATAIDENRERVAVRKLLVASCGFGDACCTALARCLARNTTLRELDLEDNEVCDCVICFIVLVLWKMQKMEIAKSVVECAIVRFFANFYFRIFVCLVVCYFIGWTVFVVVDAFDQF